MRGKLRDGVIMDKIMTEHHSRLTEIIFELSDYVDSVSSVIWRCNDNEATEKAGCMYTMKRVVSQWYDTVSAVGSKSTG